MLVAYCLGSPFPRSISRVCALVDGPKLVARVCYLGTERQHRCVCGLIGGASG